MTIVDLINAAREKAKLSPLSESEQEPNKVWYDLYLEDMLNERDWVFSYSKSSNLTLTQPSIDLGYKYVYVVGNTDVLDVISINQTFIRADVDFRDTVKYGYVTDPITDLAPAGNEQFVFVNGLLHSTTPVTEFFYKRIVKPVHMEAAFRLTLILKLAAHLAIYSTDKALKDELKAESKEYHLRACRTELKRPKDPQLAEIYDWLISYRKQASYRY